MTLFHDRSTTIEAHQWDGNVSCLVKLRKWVTGTADCPDGPNMVAPTPERAYAEILEYRIDPGDWVVKGISGEFWVMVDEDFHNHYHEANPVGHPGLTCPEAQELLDDYRGRDVDLT